MRSEDMHRKAKEKSMHCLSSAEAKRRKRGGRASDSEFGGGVDEDEPDVTTSYSGKNNVTEEAKGEMRKRGGKVKRKAGGAVATPKRKEGGKVEGEPARGRLDRPGRKRGGGVGADITPLSTASRESDRRGPSSADDARGITGEA